MGHAQLYLDHKAHCILDIPLELGEPMATPVLGKVLGLRER